MTKLTKEDIKFIDNYLDNSNVIHADIRMEMTDHVASEIENLMNEDQNLTFYNTFKEYMVNNKANLLDQNKKFVKMVDNENTKLILKELIALKTVVIFIGLVLVSFYLLKEFNPKTIRNIFAIPLFSMVPIAIVYIICSKKYNYSRFSGVERLGFMYSVLFQVIHLVSIIFRPRIKEGIDNITISIAFSVCIILLYVFVNVSYKRIKSYLLKYKTIT